MDDINDFAVEEAKRMGKQNYEYFKNNFDELYEQYNGKYIALKDCNVIGVYDDFAKGVKETAKTEKLGTFLVQHCEKETPENANRFHNNNVRFGRAQVM